MSTKRLFDIAISLILLILSLPLIVFIFLAIWLILGPPVIFRQKRWGKGKRIFTMLKFRTMVIGAEKGRGELTPINEADGPVFKIYNDPRFTKFGRFLAHTGLDELPQFINVLKGDMSLVGPRPLPVYEAKKVPKKFEKRFLVLPGITSSWVVNGSHNLSFNEWMRLDCKYASNHSLSEDVKIALSTLKLSLKSVIRVLIGIA